MIGVRFDGINEAGLNLRHDVLMLQMTAARLAELEDAVTGLTHSLEEKDATISDLQAELLSIKVVLGGQSNEGASVPAPRPLVQKKPRPPTKTEENVRLRKILNAVLPLLPSYSDVVDCADRKFLSADPRPMLVVKTKNVVGTTAANATVLKRAKVPVNTNLQRQYDGNVIWKKFDYGRNGCLNRKFKGIVHYEPNSCNARTWPGSDFRIVYEDDDDSEVVDLPTLLKLLEETPTVEGDMSTPRYVKPERKLVTTSVLLTPVRVVADKPNIVRVAEKRPVIRPTFFEDRYM
jgi:hypothetical protein